MTTLQELFGTRQPVALVTGSGAPRVGNVVVRALAGRGYRVAVHANTSVRAAEATARELDDTGSRVIAVVADLSDSHAVDEMVRRVHDRFGRIDVLVNCAAIWQRKRLEDVQLDDVRRHFEINTLGTFACCQRAGRIMIEQPTGGAIVNVGDWAIDRPYRDFAAYFPSKGAIPALTRTFAVELGTRNPRIRVNAVLPGPVMLPDDLPEAERKAVLAATLLKREGSPKNVADAVIALVENDFITGACLPVDGGRSVFGGEPVRQ